MELSIKRDSLEHFLIARAMSDENFRKQLLECPKKLVEDIIGTQLPHDLEVQTLVETPSKIYIRLPHQIMDGDQLSDTDLEMVAGGKARG